jgi:hypothetical protein
LVTACNKEGAAFRALPDCSSASSRDGKVFLTAINNKEVCALQAFGTAGRDNEFYRARGWVEDNMDRRDRELLNRQMSHFPPARRRDGIMIMAIVGVFLVGLTTGGLLFPFGSNPSTPTGSDSGKTALAFFLNGTGDTTRQ